MDRVDLEQEARIAATYAVDTWDATRSPTGKLMNYVGVCVERALAMIACEKLAKIRQPYISELVGEEWVKTPVEHSLVEDDDVVDLNGSDTPLLRREEMIDRIQIEADLQDIIDKAELTRDARQLLEMRLTPPPEFIITLRNAGRRRSVPRTTAAFLGWTQGQFDRAAKELRETLLTFLEENAR